jgi:hypothetical protein
MISALSPRRPDFKARQVLVEFVVEIVAPGQVFDVITSLVSMR